MNLWVNFVKEKIKNKIIPLKKLRLFYNTSSVLQDEESNL